MTSDTKSNVDEIINILDEENKKNVSRQELEKEFEKFMEYGVPIEQAKQTLVKKYGGDTVFTGATSSSEERILISDLEPNQYSVKLLGHVIAINPKEITVKGENKKIFFGIIGDESGTVPFTSWTEIGVEKGDVIEIQNAYTKEWQGAVQLNLGDRVHVEKTDKKRLPKNAFEPKEVTVDKLHSGMGHVDVKARILDINKREVEVSGEKKNVFSGTIGDETGKAQFTSWHDFKIKKDDVLRISGGYVKTWKGIPQLTFDSNAKVEKLEKKEIAKKDIEVNRMPLHELVEKRGALGVEVEGTIIDIRAGSGFVMRCPECNRVLNDGRCSIHDTVEGKPDMRLKLVVDDGTGAVSCVINRDLSEKILDMKLDEAKKMKEDEMQEKLQKMLFAKKIMLKGNALGDEFGTNIIVNDAGFVDTDVSDEAEKIIDSLEDIL